MIKLYPNLTIKPNFLGKLCYWDLLLLGLWTLLGFCLRFANLTLKPLWTDEFATIVFSLGNNYQSILLNQAIKLEQLLQPLRPNYNASLGNVASFLLNEDNHPPLYFWLSHLWLKLFPLDGEYVSLWAVRSLPALLGVLSIPAIYYLARLAFSSRLIAQLAAVMMAVSPYGIYLAQESRHYTLGVLWVIFSLCCLVVAVRYLQEKRVIPWGLVWLWTLVNCIGLGVHYFFGISLMAEAIALIIWLGLDIKGFIISHQEHEYIKDSQENLQLIKILTSRYILGKNGWRLGLVVIGTLTTALIWMLTMIPADYGNGMTNWMKQIFSFRALISPIFQLLAAWITMICLLPVESDNLGLVIISGLIMLLFFIWLTPRLYRGLKISLQSYQSALGVQVLAGFVFGAIALFLGITYILGMDITKGARYNFVYFPAVIALIGASLGGLWYGTSLGWGLGNRFNLSPKNQGKIAVIFICLMGLLGGITVNVNLGYQKYYLPNQLVKTITENSTNQVLIATTHQSLVHTGEMMGIAWELRKHPLAEKTQFLLAHKPAADYFTPTATIQNTVRKLTHSHPLDLWIVNFSKEPENGLEPLTLDMHKLPSCDPDHQTFPYINGYNYQHYRCQL